MKKFCFTLIAFLLMLLIMFGIGEIMFRIFRGDPNPLANVTQQKVDHLFEPNSVLDGRSSVEGEFAYTAHINSLGYRGKEFNLTKDPDTIRILVVGDSFTFGVGAEDDETIPARIEQNLKKLGYNTEVINAGIGHTSPITHYLNMKNLHLKLNPDLVVLLYDMTDLNDDWTVEKHAVYDKNGEISHFDGTYVNGRRSLWRTAVMHSAFCKWIHNKIVRTYQKIAQIGIKNYITDKLAKKKKAKVVIMNDPNSSPETIMKYDAMIMMRGKPKEDVIRENFKRSAKYMLLIQDLLDEREIPLILVTYPHGIYVGPQEWNEGRKTWGFEQNTVYKDYLAFDILEDFAEDNEIPFINTLNAFLIDQDDEKPYFFNYDGHMTPRGYKKVADTISTHPEFMELIKGYALSESHY